MPDDTILTATPPIIEPIPTGLGPQSIPTKFGDKYRAEFAKLEKTVEPDAVQTPPEAPSKEAEPDSKPPEAPSKDENVVKSPPSKVESPLDAVLAKDKPESKKVEEQDELDSIETPTKSDWSKARAARRALRDELESLKGTTKTATPDEVSTWQKKTEELEAALADRETRLKAAGAEYSPDYQKLVGKYQATAEKIKTRMQSFGGDGDSLLAALSLPYSKVRTDQIDAALSDLDGGKQARVQTLIEELEGHGEEIAEFRKDLPARYEEMTARQEQAAREQQANAIKQLETEFLKISETIPDSIVTMREVPEDVPGGTEWNKEITEARENALRILKPDGSDFNESASIALKGARYDSLEKRYLSLHKDYSELKKRFKDEDAAGADFKGGTKPTVKGKKDFGKSYSQILATMNRGDMADV